MSSFLATPAPSDSAPKPAVTLKNDGWFPDITLAELRDETRLDGTVTDARLRAAAVEAMASCNSELGNWQALKVAAGYADLASVPASKLDDTSVLVQRYRRAISNHVRADLTEKYRGLDTTKSGGQKAEEIEETICEAWRNVRHAIADILGTPRTTVELI